MLDLEPGVLLRPPRARKELAFSCLEVLAGKCWAREDCRQGGASAGADLGLSSPPCSVHTYCWWLASSEWAEASAPLEITFWGLGAHSTVHQHPNLEAVHFFLGAVVRVGGDNGLRMVSGAVSTVCPPCVSGVLAMDWPRSHRSRCLNDWYGAGAAVSHRAFLGAAGCEGDAPQNGSPGVTCEEPGQSFLGERVAPGEVAWPRSTHGVGRCEGAWCADSGRTVSTGGTGGPGWTAAGRRSGALGVLSSEPSQGILGEQTDVQVCVSGKHPKWEWAAGLRGQVPECCWTGPVRPVGRGALRCPHVYCLPGAGVGCHLPRSWLLHSIFNHSQPGLRNWHDSWQDCCRFRANCSWSVRSHPGGREEISEAPEEAGRESWVLAAS